MKYCIGCGKPIEEQAAFCSSCGMAQAGPQMPQAGPQMPQTGPQMPQAGPQMPQAGPQMPQAGPQMPQAGQQMPQAGQQMPQATPQMLQPASSGKKSNKLPIILAATAVVVVAAILLLVFQPWAAVVTTTSIATSRAEVSSQAEAIAAEPEEEEDIVAVVEANTTTGMPQDFLVQIEGWNNSKCIVSTANGSLIDLQTSRYMYNAIYTADNTRMVYRVSDEDDESLYMLDIATGQPALITTGYMYDRQLLPDGETLFLNDREGLYRYTLPGLEQELLLTNVSSFVASPVGAKLLVSSGRTAYVQDLENDSTQLLNVASSITPLSVSEDGNTLVYYTYDDSRVFHFANMATGETETLEASGGYKLYLTRSADAALLSCDDGLWLYRQGELIQLDRTSTSNTVVLTAKVLAKTDNASYILDIDNFGSIFWLADGSTHASGTGHALVHQDAEGEIRYIDTPDTGYSTDIYVTEEYGTVLYTQGGTLKRASLANGLEPEELAQDVASFATSPKGDAIVYKSEDDWLYYRTADGNETRLGEKISDYWLGGKDGRDVTYAVSSYSAMPGAMHYHPDSGTTTISADAYAVYAMAANGSVLYVTGDYSTSYDMYLWQDGESSLIVEDCGYPTTPRKGDWYNNSDDIY